MPQQAAFGVGIIIEAKPQADHKDENEDDVVLEGVIVEGPVKAVFRFLFQTANFLPFSPPPHSSSHSSPLMVGLVPCILHIQSNSQ